MHLPLPQHAPRTPISVQPCTFSFAPSPRSAYPLRAAISTKQISAPQVKPPSPFSPSLAIYVPQRLVSPFFLPLRMFILRAVLQEGTASPFPIPSTELFILLSHPGFTSSSCKEQTTTQKPHPNHPAGISEKTFCSLKADFFFHATLDDVKHSRAVAADGLVTKPRH